MVELASAAVMHDESLTKAAKGCGLAFYLVHSMNHQNKDITEADRKTTVKCTVFPAGDR
jgi:hypothetical protein